MKTIVVSAGDQTYFPLLQELIASLKAQSGFEECDLGVLNVGMTPDQAHEIQNEGAQIVTPDWPCALPKNKIADKEFMKACVCRPFINTYFPGYDTYLWLDTDTWVQTWEGPDLLQQGAAKGRMACTLLMDRGYGFAPKVRWFGPFPVKFRGFYFANAKRAFGYRVAQRLFEFPTASAGAFALPADAPHWQRWQELVVKALKRGKLFTAEQLSLGIMLHLDKYAAEFLPAWTHWASPGRLLLDKKTGRLVEKYLPHHPISILHLSGLDAMRRDPGVTQTLPVLQGGHIETCLRYGHIRDMEAS